MEGVPYLISLLNYSSSWPIIYRNTRELVILFFLLSLFIFVWDFETTKVFTTEVAKYYIFNYVFYSYRFCVGTSMAVLENGVSSVYHWFSLF